MKGRVAYPRQRISARDLNPNKHYVVSKIYYIFLCFGFAAMLLFSVSTAWYAYNLKIDLGEARIELRWAEENLSIWKSSNQTLAVQAKQKDDYIREILKRLKQMQDEISIVELKEEDPKWLNTSKK